MGITPNFLPLDPSILVRTLDPPGNVNLMSGYVKCSVFSHVVRGIKSLMWEVNYLVSSLSGQVTDPLALTASPSVKVLAAD